MAPSEDAQLELTSRRTRRLLAAAGRRGDDREAALLNVAEQLSSQDRLGEASISEIATAAGISRPGFYFYFQSKDELLAQLVAKTLKDSMEWHIDAATVEPVAFTAELIAGTARMWREHRALLCSAVELAPRVPALHEQWTHAVTRSGTVLAQLVVSKTTIADLRTAPAARAMVETLIWMVERNFYMLAISEHTPEDEQALVDRLTGAWCRTVGFVAEGSDSE